MSNHLIKSAIVFFVLSGFSANRANAQSVSNRDQTKNESATNAVDLSTDKAVLVELQKIVDARNAELTKSDEKLEAKRKAASKLEPKDVCVNRLKESAKVIVIGFFADDAGCRFDGVFVNSRYFETGNAALSKYALDALGWEKANPKERERLAKLWVEKCFYAFSRLSNQTFGVVSTGDQIKVIVSLKYPPGVTSRHGPTIFLFNKYSGLLPAIGN